MPSGFLNQDIILARFGGRVNVPQVKDHTFLKAFQSPNSQNVDTSGESIRKMKGFSKVTTSTVGGDISSIYYDEFTNNIYVGYADKLGKVSGSAIVQLSGASGFSNNSIWSFSRVKDSLVAMNGTDAPRLWNEGTSTLSLIGTPPVTWGPGAYPSFSANWMGRCFAAGVAGQTDVLFYSKLYDANDWTSGTTATNGGALVIGRDGIPIKAIYPLAEGLLIFKDPGLYYLSGGFDTSGNFDQTKFDWSILSSQVDARSHRSVVANADAVFSLGRRSVWHMRGTEAQQKIQVESVSQNIAFDIAQISMATDQITAVHYAARNQIWFSVAKDTGSTTIDTTYVYDYLNVDPDDNQGQWFLRNGYAHKCHASVRDTMGTYQIYSGGYASTGLLYKQNDTPNYDGAAISCYYQTSWIPLVGLPKGKPVVSVISLGAQTVGPVTYSYGYDFQTADYDSFTLVPEVPTSVWHTGAGSSWGTGGGTTGTWQSGTGGTSTDVLYGSGRRIQHRFYSNLVDADFAILEVKHPSITLGYR